MTATRYVIEVRGEPAGLVVAERIGFRFYASASTFADLEQRIFRSPGQAEDACRKLVSHQAISRQRDAGVAPPPGSFIPEGGLPYGFPFIVE